MKFFSLEDSKKLAEMGCKSLTRFGYDKYGHVRKLPHGDSVAGYALDEFGPYSEVFQPQIDFLGDSEQARRNCEILWPKVNQILTACPHNIPGCLVAHFKSEQEWLGKRCEMLSSHDHIEFVKGFLK